MSTAALSAPHLEISAADTMDTHPEDRLDFDNSDIDIDVHSTGEHDDDVSLRDAGTDAGQDISTVLGDQDDFMADHEDLIEEDIVDLDIDVMEQPGSNNPDEDLIDYSDDEDAAVQDAPIVTATQEHDIDDAIAVEDEQKNLVVNIESRSSENLGEEEAVAHAADESHAHDKPTPAEEQESLPKQQHNERSSTQEQDEIGHDEYVEADATRNNTHEPERRASEPAVDSLAATGTETVPGEQSGQETQENNFYPVNVNFGGHDYWLFKDHDYEDSGDYLLEDDAQFMQPVNTIIDACRTALRTLGSDVPHDMELGFCLDSLHSVELYEDHPACHLATLNQILRVYLQLHAQDGNTDPGYFCISLVSRPRVYSLLEELTQAAQKGIGFSGLNSSIAAGTSLFNTHILSQSPEQGFVEWESGDEREAQSENQSGLQADQEDDGEPDTHEEGPVRELGDEHDPDAPFDANTETANEESGHEQLTSAAPDVHDERDVWQQNEHKQEVEQVDEHDEIYRDGTADAANEQPEDVVTTTDTPSTNVAAENASTIANTSEEKLANNTATEDVDSQHAQEDLLDYSDDEDNEAPENEVQITQASSDSATVQGDDLAQKEDHTEDATHNEQEGGAPGETEEFTFDGQAGQGDETFIDYEGLEHETHEYEGDEYDGHEVEGHEYDDRNYPYGEHDAQQQESQGDYDQGYTGDQDFEGYPAYDVFQDEENANYLDENEQQLTDDPNDTFVHAGVDAGEFDAAADAFDEANDPLDLDGAAAAAQQVQDQHAAEDDIDYSDEEDGAASQAQVATSAAANMVATSSSDLQNLSPQGQKRTIDEVGNDAGDASNSAGMSRSERSSLPIQNTVLTGQSDAKRPRV
ncbi:hypothetical protein GRF29_69g1693448 [Pseudopithomyces chartarum]|uniref:Uncharacterized protein n=1 Tax=Pseudopithomyces chartarum TaxID=1892770 RepID=A0AAN6RIL4_9PLEO|nr:hypothetical protein GRF29_69g1693448 [Pseudopithomyces chartarum]